jgi:thiamine pyrophosphokinase
MPAEESVSNGVVVVVSGGEPPAHLDVVPAGATVVAADRGLEHAQALGLATSVAVGDFDSVSPEALAAAEKAGVAIERHPPEKDATDLELALDRALALGARRILVLAGHGGRIDHELASLLLLASDRYADVEVDALVGGARLHVIREARELAGSPGELVTLLAVGGVANGVRTKGLAYPLHGDTLEPGSTRGVSNAFSEPTAEVSLERGVLLAIRPGEGK